MPRCASISIDLDGLEHYHSIHGLPAPSGGNPIYEVALPRFLELFEERNIRATLFVITRDLEQPAVRAGLERAIAAGHEVASHSHTHPYDFTRLSPPQIADELDTAAQRLESQLGVRPVGFRAPGYSVSNSLVTQLRERGYRYASSVFPCPPYYLAKAAVMMGMRLVGRRSGSALTDPRAWLSPIRPYRPVQGAFYRNRSEETVSSSPSLWEIPICVLPWVRAPIIGTSLALMGRGAFLRLYPLLARAHRWLNLELHGVDLLGPTDPGVDPQLVRRQPDLRRGWGEKRSTFRAVFEQVGRDYRFVPLAEMADQLDRTDRSG